MFTLQRIETSAQEIKKSRFLAIAGPIEDELSAKTFIAARSDPAANHNCWAWRAGQSYRFSDDGEPSGTAGKPILAAIDGQSLDRVAVVVTRWFGGVLLGSGGLVRAYGGTAALCLRAAEKIELIERQRAESPATSPISRSSRRGWQRAACRSPPRPSPAPAQCCRPRYGKTRWTTCSPS